MTLIKDMMICWLEKISGGSLNSKTMKLSQFDYKTPTSKKEVVDLLINLGQDSAILAGGTDLIPNMKNGTLIPKTLVSLNHLSAQKEQLTTDGSLKLDALSTLSQIAESPLIKEKAPSLAQAAFHVGGQQIRNRATLGGNLCQESRCLYLNQSHDFQFVAACYKRAGDCCYPFPDGGRICRAVFMSDMAPVLITLDARLVVLTSQGERQVDIADFYTGDGLKPVNLGPNELITSVLIPLESQKMQCRFIKATPRGGLEFAMVSIAVALTLDKQDKKCSKALIAVGSINTKPMRALTAEKQLTGSLLNESNVVDVSKTAANEIKPLPHHGYSPGYLKQLIEVYIKRSLIHIIKTVDTKSG
jgi:CO/xanthine dehydrogenase FAD-binding subunit